MKFQNILMKEDSGICFITLNRPEARNALDPKTWEEIRCAIRTCRSEKEIRVVIITGTGGKAFASGVDIRALRERETLAVLDGETQEALNDIENLNKPVIAAIDGFALGGGCELAMACDIRIATGRSKLGQPEVNLGIIPGAGGTKRLQRLVGIGKAKELVFTGDIISASDAEKIGLVNRVIDDPQDLLPFAREMALKIISKGPVALSLAKIVINAGCDINLNAGLLFEKLAQTIAFSTKDRIEGISAFLDKRKANFKGK